MKYIIRSTDSHDRLSTGGKATSLAGLKSGGFAVPEWFVITPDAFLAGLSAADKEAYCSMQALAMLGKDELCSVQELIDGFVVPDDLLHELDEAVDLLEGRFFAVRSSGMDEDGSKHSCAGQLESFLFVPGEEIKARMKDVWRSAFSARIVAYRKERGLTSLPSLPAVIVQEMVNASAAGVAFTRDPNTGEVACIIAATHGLGQGLVSGEIDADTYIVRSDATEIHVVKKLTALQFDVEAARGIAAVPIDELSARKAALSKRQIEDVANLAYRAERFFGCPQDVEWAVAGDRLYVLQSRPITTIGDDGKIRQEELRIFDNSNIGESYSGVTTPLTFTFARSAYEAVYRQFLKLMLVPDRRLAANEQVFPHMIALVRGRIYYNLVNWYRVLAMLPGYKSNRSFMEQMMGVKKRLPEEVTIGQAGSSTPLDLVVDVFSSLFSLCGLFINYACLSRKMTAFYQRLNRALAPVELSEMSLDELMAYYRRLESQLLRKWDAPIINDFFAMIYFGVLRKLTVVWCRDTNSSLQNDLLSGTGKIISAEPARRIRQMAGLVAQDEELSSLLSKASQSEVERVISRWTEFKQLYDEYLLRFGDRCLGELKLESYTLVDDALPLLRSVGQMSRRLRNGERTVSRSGMLSRRRAERRAYQAIGRNPFKRAVFALVLHNARQAVRNRENLRFERTRVFGVVRKIFLQIGRRLGEQGLLADSRDVFYLQLDEIMDHIEGTRASGGWKELVLVRKHEFDLYALDKDPPDRMEVRGSINLTLPSNLLPAEHPDADAQQCEFRGLACSPGVVKGRVRVVVDPKDACLEPGDILVAKRTDPGWITLFPAAAGLLVEHGSVLSHVAIVARELGLPAILSIPHLTEVLRNGDFVELNGATGIVRRLNQLPVEAHCEAI